MTYNVLADTYSETDFSKTVLYPYCPPYALEFDYRKLLILKELTGTILSKCINNLMIQLARDLLFQVAEEVR